MPVPKGEFLFRHTHTTEFLVFFHWTAHQLLSVLLPCTGAEQLHVEESENSQQLWLQVVCLPQQQTTQQVHIID